MRVRTDHCGENADVGFLAHTVEPTGVYLV